MMGHMDTRNDAAHECSSLNALFVLVLTIAAPGAAQLACIVRLLTAKADAKWSWQAGEPSLDGIDIELAARVWCCGGAVAASRQCVYGTRARAGVGSCGELAGGALASWRCARSLAAGAPVSPVMVRAHKSGAEYWQVLHNELETELERTNHHEKAWTWGGWLALTMGNGSSMVLHNNSLPPIWYPPNAKVDNAYGYRSSNVDVPHIGIWMMTSSLLLVPNLAK